MAEASPGKRSRESPRAAGMSASTVVVHRMERVVAGLASEAVEQRSGDVPANSWRWDGRIWSRLSLCDARCERRCRSMVALSTSTGRALSGWNADVLAGVTISVRCTLERRKRTRRVEAMAMQNKARRAHMMTTATMAAITSRAGRRSYSVVMAPMDVPYTSSSSWAVVRLATTEAVPVTRSVATIWEPQVKQPSMPGWIE
eukprot:scaffold89210_cov29-Tisochrysis_lutea.AAC.3